MKASEARKLIREYYEYRGEKVKVLRKLKQTVYPGTDFEHQVEGYLCLTDKNKYTVVELSYDSHNDPYAKEVVWGGSEDGAIKEWRDTFEYDS